MSVLISVKFVICDLHVIINSFIFKTKTRFVYSIIYYFNKLNVVNGLVSCYK